MYSAISPVRAVNAARGLRPFDVTVGLGPCGDKRLLRIDATDSMSALDSALKQLVHAQTLEPIRSLVVRPHRVALTH